MAKSPRPSSRRRKSVEELSIEAVKRMPTAAREIYSRALLSISATSSMNRLWERLTHAQRKRLMSTRRNPPRPKGPSLLDPDLKLAIEEHGGLIQMWRHLTGVSHARAVVEIAQRLSFLDLPTTEWLLRELGEVLEDSDPESVPVWDSGRGKLLLKSRTVRTVRIMKIPANIQIILDAFQDASWPRTIQNPIPGGEQQRLHQALRSLNHGLKGIRFGSAHGGRSIRWELA